MTKLIFEGNFIAKLLTCYRKCKRIAKIAKKIWQNRNGFDSNSEIHYLRLDESLKSVQFTKFEIRSMDQV